MFCNDYKDYYKKNCSKELIATIWARNVHFSYINIFLLELISRKLHYSYSSGSENYMDRLFGNDFLAKSHFSYTKKVFGIYFIMLKNNSNYYIPLSPQAYPTGKNLNELFLALLDRIISGKYFKRVNLIKILAHYRKHLAVHRSDDSRTDLSVNKILQ